MDNARENRARIDTHDLVTRYLRRVNKTPWYQIAKQRAKDRGLGYQAIADYLGVHKSAVGHWFTGRYRCPFETIQRIAVLLDTTVTELIAEDPYYITDDNERAIIDSVRNVPADQREQLRRMIEAFAAPASDKPETD